MKRRQFPHVIIGIIGLAAVTVSLAAIGVERSNASPDETTLSGSRALAIAIAVDAHKLTKDPYPIEDYEVHQYSTPTEYVVDLAYAIPDTSKTSHLVNEGWEYRIDKKTFRITHIYY